VLVSEVFLIVKNAWAKILLSAAVLLASAHVAASGQGKKEYDKFVKEGMVYDDPVWQDYVQKLGDRLVSYSPEPNRKFHFTVINGADVNAYSLGDEYIFIYRGLIAYMESEDQLAGVMGHEIGHVVLHHMSRTESAQTAGKIAGFVGAVLTGQGQVMDTANQYTNQQVAGYGREHELEADRMGGELLAKAGYNPFAMLDVIQALKDQEQFSSQVLGEQKTYHGLFASHPQNDKRLHDAIAEGEKYLPDQVVEPVGDFWQNMNGLVYGDQAGMGIVKDQTYFHEGLRIVVTFPDGWDVTSSASKVTAASPAGATVSSITFQKQATPTKKQTPKEYITDTLQRDVTSGEALKVGDYDAYIGKLDVANTNLKASLIAVIYKDGSVYLFKGEAAETADVAKFEADFRATVMGFRAMMPADMKIANNQRIKVIEAKPGDTYKLLAAKTSLKSHPEETLRLLNGQMPLGEPRPGDPIKIVQ
jgi:predicted Zn-dependent protease